MRRGIQDEVADSSAGRPSMGRLPKATWALQSFQKRLDGEFLEGWKGHEKQGRAHVRTAAIGAALSGVCGLVDSSFDNARKRRNKPQKHDCQCLRLLSDGPNLMPCGWL